MFKQFAILVLVFATGTAFQAGAPAFLPRTKLASTTARQVLLSDAETESILQSAMECAEGECSLDDVSQLVMELKEQEKILSTRLDAIMNMISDLQHINEKDERKTDEVRAFVNDMLSVFSQGKQYATGFSGDIPKGTKTAYDSLNPKPWKPKTN